MSDFLTAAEALLGSTFFLGVGFLIVCAYVWAARMDKQDRIAAARAEENRRTRDHIGICGETYGALVCGRAAGHADDFHADWSKDTARPIKWRDAMGGAA